MVAVVMAMWRGRVSTGGGDADASWNLLPLAVGPERCDASDDEEMYAEEHASKRTRAAVGAPRPSSWTWGVRRGSERACGMHGGGGAHGWVTRLGFFSGLGTQM